MYDELKKKLVESADATEKYNLNKKIISFSEIPGYGKRVPP